MAEIERYKGNKERVVNALSAYLAEGKIEAKLMCLSYDVLCMLKEYCNDNALGQLITNEILSFSMKATELAVRRKRLCKERKMKLPDHREEAIAFMPVFTENGLVDKSFTFRKLTDEELLHKKILAKPPIPGTHCTVRSKRHFQRNLEAFTNLHGISKILQPNVLIMGGCILACLQCMPTEIEEMHDHLDL